MIDHTSLSISDFARSKSFYDAVLATLGYACAVQLTPEQTGGRDVAGYGGQAGVPFWISTGTRGGYTHIAFSAKSHAEVDAFHRAALAAGGVDNGAPGPRAHYSPTYYGGFVLDPDGNNVEAVFRG